MVASTVLADLGTTCKRYGPGRLPRADHRDVGAGYAMASAAFGVTVLYAFIARTLEALGSPIGSDWHFLGTMAAYALPLVVPVAFASAVVVWRLLPDHLPHFGAVGGLVATIGTYLGSYVVLFVLATVHVFVSGETATASELLVDLGFIVFIAFATTFWLTLPAGCASGVIHERIRAHGS